MGCHCSMKAQFSSDFQSEDAIMMHETALGFGGLSASTVTNLVKVFSRKGKLRLKKLIDVLMALELPFSQLESRDGPMFKFYQLLTEKKVYTVKKLSILGTILGTGSLDKKAAILFSLYEDRSTYTVTTLEVNLIIRNAFQIAFECVPKYAEFEMTVMQDMESLKKLEKYMHKLKKRQKRVAEIVRNGILQGKTSIPVDKFVKNLCENCDFLLSSHSLRWFTVKLPELDGEMETQQSPDNSGSELSEEIAADDEEFDDAENEFEGDEEEQEDVGPSP